MSSFSSLRLAFRRSHVRLSKCGLPGRYFHESAITESGHSRWSKIKHDKGANDAVKNKARSVVAQEIATASKLFGPDPGGNPRLADLITKAKRTGFAKASIESAIARGQGRSTSGAALEQLTVETILPGNIGVVIECETDNKPRTLADVRTVIKDHGGSVTPTSYLFAKKGKIVFEKKEGMDADEALEQALDAGALDVIEDDEGRVIVFTEPSETKAAGETLSSGLGLDIASSEIIWDPVEDTLVPLEGEKSVDDIGTFVEALQEKENTVQGIYMNIAQGSADEDTWAALQSRIAA